MLSSFSFVKIPEKTATISSNTANMPAVDVVDQVPAVSGKETAQSVAAVEELIKNLSISKTADEGKAHANSLASLLNGPIEELTVPIDRKSVV